MPDLRLVPATYDSSPRVEAFEDATIYQTLPWLSFLREEHGGDIRVATVLDADARPVGRFTGMTTRVAGLRMLGSPLPGWTTQYLGFNLEPGIARFEALRALPAFAFRALRCAHLEVMDRRATAEDHERAGFRHEPMRTFEIDLSQDEDAIYGAMTSTCRWSVRRAEREGVVIEVADPDGFADDYYAQLEDVFAKQALVPTYAKSRVEALIRHLHPTGHLLLLRARDPEGTSIATGIFPSWNGTMYFWGGASWRQHQRLQPNESLMWHAMRYWKSRGAKRLDMGGGGDYKRKYGGTELFVPWGRRSVSPLLDVARDGARRAIGLRQKLAARRAG